MVDGWAAWRPLPAIAYSQTQIDRGNQVHSPGAARTAQDVLVESYAYQRRIFRSERD